MYLGGAKKQKWWYNNATSASEKEEERSGSDGSQEDIMPMGKIVVRHGVREDEGTLPPPPAHAY